MNIRSYDVADPYLHHPMCQHRDRRTGGLIAEKAKDVPPFILYSSLATPESGVELQFFGEVYQEIQWEGIDEDGRQVAELAIVKFHMAAQHPQLGALDLSLDGTRPGNVGQLRAANPGQKFPVVHTSRLHVIASVAAQPGMVLQSAGPAMTFTSEPLMTWPPEDNIYRLATRVDFEPRLGKGPPVISTTPGGAIVGRVRPPESI